MNPDLAAQIAGALGWWREAGVDCDFVDDPVRWLETAPPPAPPAAIAGGEASAVQPGRTGSRRPAIGDAVSVAEIADIPDEHAAFLDWWRSAPFPGDGRTGGRISPRGPRGAELMILVAQPEREDVDRLLSGSDGRFVEAIAHAMGMAAQSIYLASVLARHTPGLDWEEPAVRALAPVVRRHVRLAAPKLLVAAGSNILPLLGHEPPQRPALLREFNHEGVTIPMLAPGELAGLRTRPGRKAAFWRAWLARDRA